MRTFDVGRLTFDVGLKTWDLKLYQALAPNGAVQGKLLIIINFELET